MTERRYVFHTDPGHAWLKVPVAEVEDAGIAVSRYSYRNAGYAYLEEDVDAVRFLNALKRAGIKYALTFVHSEGVSEIRGYSRYEEGA